MCTQVSIIAVQWLIQWRAGLFGGVTFANVVHIGFRTELEPDLVTLLPTHNLLRNLGCTRDLNVS